MEKFNSAKEIVLRPQPGLFCRVYSPLADTFIAFDSTDDIKLHEDNFIHVPGNVEVTYVKEETLKQQVKVTRRVQGAKKNSKNKRKLQRASRKNNR